MEHVLAGIRVMEGSVSSMTRRIVLDASFCCDGTTWGRKRLALLQSRKETFPTPRTRRCAILRRDQA